METESSSSQTDELQDISNAFEITTRSHSRRNTVFMSNPEQISPAAVVEPKRVRSRRNKITRSVLMMLMKITGLKESRAEIAVELCSNEETGTFEESIALNNGELSRAIFIQQSKLVTTDQLKFKFVIKVSPLPNSEEGCEPPAKVSRTEKSYWAELKQLNDLRVMTEREFYYQFVCDIYEESVSFHQTGDGLSNRTVSKVVEEMKLQVQILWADEAPDELDGAQFTTVDIVNYKFDQETSPEREVQTGLRSEIPGDPLYIDDSADDSENEDYPEWLKKERKNIIEAASGIARKERSFQVMWNEFQLENRFDQDMEEKCIKFVDEKGQQMVKEKMESLMFVFLENVAVTNSISFEAIGTIIEKLNLIKLNENRAQDEDVDTMIESIN